MSRAEYRAFVEANPELRIERTAEGEVVVMPPVHGRTGYRNSEVSGQLRNWARKDGTGVAFDSSAGFDLPNGSNRSPDASWVLKSRIAVLTEAERDDYLPLAPDFAVEIRSKSDRLSAVQAKMREYIENGSRLCWLMDPSSRRVYVYRPGREVETLHAPAMLRGDPELAGFELDLKFVWDPEV